ncbi:mandelate racemase, partial [Bifidobacterium catulorum]
YVAPTAPGNGCEMNLETTEKYLHKD